MKPFDLSEPAANGLRRGYTTGSCATAGVKSALWKLLYDEVLEEVEILLPGQQEILKLPIQSVEETDGGMIARVVKDAGDDPDQTHRATILVKVSAREQTGIRFRAGRGVGIVRQAGLQVPVGEPAINPVPRRMMQWAVEEVCADVESAPAGFEIEVGCEGGEEIAKRTFNPRLGIEGGISILGTTGIVEPKSMASFKASIEIYINVAIAENAQEVVFSPGNLGQRFARESLDLELRQVVQTSNFVGFALDHLKKKMAEEQRQLPVLWMVGHPGKLAKLIDNHWDTHSNASPPAMEIIERIAAECSLEIGPLNTVEEAAVRYREATTLWAQVAESIHEKVADYMGDHVGEVRVRLFSMAGKRLNSA
ncbi:MAG: cobalt-precorrin-5B (C(1))-methyltransferase CbiD [Verrucomicrobiota bacterium]